MISSINQKAQETLNTICCSIALVDQLSPGKDNIVLDFAISKARQTSWASAFILSDSISFIRPSLVNMIGNATTLVARNIIISKNTPPKLLKSLQACENTDVTKNIEILSKI
ncbi:hypothetical protein RCH13_002452 [Chryseobacterium sp. MP_3.2]|nr:hypothetical protein [Chryseobacterium sp. MP_3.2]